MGFTEQWPWDLSSYPLIYEQVYDLVNTDDIFTCLLFVITHNCKYHFRLLMSENCLNNDVLVHMHICHLEWCTAVTLKSVRSANEPVCLCTPASLTHIREKSFPCELGHIDWIC